MGLARLMIIMKPLIKDISWQMQNFTDTRITY